MGAFKTVMRNPFIALCATVYFLLHLALNGLQINFVNYTQYKFGWNVAQSSSSLCLIFIFTAVMPRLLLPLLGIRKAIQCVFNKNISGAHTTHTRARITFPAHSFRTTTTQDLLPPLRRRILPPRHRQPHRRRPPQPRRHRRRLRLPPRHARAAHQPGTGRGVEIRCHPLVSLPLPASLPLTHTYANNNTHPATQPTPTRQVSASEKGAMNGAADTVRTLSSALGFPLMTSLFGYFISDKAPFKLPGA